LSELYLSSGGTRKSFKRVGGNLNQINNENERFAV
jgi:hypothetical protein